CSWYYISKVAFICQPYIFSSKYFLTSVPRHFVILTFIFPIIRQKSRNGSQLKQLLNGFQIVSYKLSSSGCCGISSPALVPYSACLTILSVKSYTHLVPVT